MSNFVKKYGKFIPGTVILLLHLLFVILVTTGDFSGPRIAAGKDWVKGIGLFFMAVTVVYGYLYPVDAPDLKHGGVNAPTALGLGILIVCTVLGWTLYYWGGVNHF
jgi:hypothetical protein